MKKYYFLAILVTCTALFTGCQDDLVNNTTYNDGYLHFKFLFDKKGEWKDDGASGPQTRVMAPIEMTLPEDFDTPLYLHCVESSEIETAAEDTTETRGERITGEAFDSGKINGFGLYAVVGVAGDPSTYEEVLATSETYTDPGTSTTININSKYTEILRSSLTAEGDWRVSNQSLNFADAADMWTDAKTGNFYGFAPLPGWDGAGAGGDASRTRCYTVNADDKSAPTITFTMQPEEQYNKDILMAKATTVGRDQKDEGIELEFKHVLSALKFKLDDKDDANGTNDLQYTAAGTNYYMQVKSITIEGIYDQGTVGIGDTDWTADATSIGSCTAELTRSYSDVTGDANKLINTDEHCMMVLPQAIPAISSTDKNKNAKLIITVDLTKNADGTGNKKENITFEAPLNGLTWQPGHSYTYSISKDRRLTNYTLTSTYNSTNGGAFSFKVDGTKTDGYPDTDFTVVSYATYTDVGSSPTRKPVPWHIEYSEDGGTTWKKGLPLGYAVQNKTTKQYVSALDAIDGSETGEVYTLKAQPRLDDNTASLTTLKANNYSDYSGDDYYDLSLHGIGFSPTVCSQTTARNTANCYIVQGYGRFKLPLVYGNGVKQGLPNTKAFQYTWSGNGYGVFVDHKGNQINQAWLSDQGITCTSAEIVWQDHDNIVRSENVRADANFLYFEILENDVQPGNVLLAAKDADGIAWSWHIWVTPATDVAETVEWTANVKTTATRKKSGSTYTWSYTNSDVTLDIAKYDLGWTTPEIESYKGDKNFILRVIQNDKTGQYVDHPVSMGDGFRSIDGSSVVYQNGRKDPFPNMSAGVKNFTRVSGEITSVEYKALSLFPQCGISVPTSKASSMQETIKNPNTFYWVSGGNWFTYSGYSGAMQRYGCWDLPENAGGYSDSETSTNSFPPAICEHTIGTKTIHDPCPVGFMVPPSCFANMFGTGTTITPTTTTTVDGNSIDLPIPYLTVSKGGNNLTFYMPGARRSRYMSAGDTDENGDAITKPYNGSFGLTDFQNANYFWTTGIYNVYGVYAKVFESGTFELPLDSYNDDDRKSVSNGMAIRPIRDPNQGTIEAYGSSPVKTYHEGDMLNVTLAPNGSTTNYGITTWSDLVVDMQIGPDATLGSIINDVDKENKKLLIKNIRVEFEYTGSTYGIFDVGGLLLGHRTQNPYSISHTLGTKTEKHGQNAYVLVIDIPDYYVFSSGWVTKYSEESNGAATGWDFVNLVPLTTSKARITGVTADLRISYTTN